MALHKSLRRKSRLVRQRSVYSREERINLLVADEKWVEGQSPIGLPKQRVFRATVGKKKKVKKEEDADAKGGKGAKGAKGGAPAAKAGAPAAKAGAPAAKAGAPGAKAGAKK